MKLEVTTSAADGIYSERVVLMGADGREVYRGYSKPFPEGAKEELEFQGRLFALNGESMGCKMFKDAGPAPEGETKPPVQDEASGVIIPPAPTAPSPQ